ncbi:hypothetical protein J2W40_001475 [Sphingobium xenophagum]|uniref:Uncharacterized protein n=1 Tax=Sphingobium xenophagum TaxID=121428 RepID=A0ABU1WZB0_SPHXE|nr:hypothetical protein [Sphingobium xenophagum]MDR7154660.1 hypothetical protein [Sphingobium xenophagum]
MGQYIYFCGYQMVNAHVRLPQNGNFLPAKAARRIGATPTFTHKCMKNNIFKKYVPAAKGRLRPAVIPFRGRKCSIAAT